LAVSLTTGQSRPNFPDDPSEPIFSPQAAFGGFSGLVFTIVRKAAHVSCFFNLEWSRLQHFPNSRAGGQNPLPHAKAIRNQPLPERSLFAQRITEGISIHFTALPELWPYGCSAL
jgi:hypothetical protein